MPWSSAGGPSSLLRCFSRRRALRRRPALLRTRRASERSRASSAACSRSGGTFRDPPVLAPAERESPDRVLEEFTQGRVASLNAPGSCASGLLSPSRQSRESSSTAPTAPCTRSPRSRSARRAPGPGSRAATRHRDLSRLAREIPLRDAGEASELFSQHGFELVSSKNRARSRRTCPVVVFRRKP